MQARFVKVVVLFGFHVRLCATAASSARVSKAARAAVSSEGSIIPDWRLDTMNSDVTVPTLLEHTAEHAPAPVPLGVPQPRGHELTSGPGTSGPGDGLPEANLCHPLKLPSQVHLVAHDQTWRSLTGSWYGRDEVQLAHWQRNHFRTDQVTMFVNSDVERALTLEEASSKTDDEMISEYDWRPIVEAEPALNIPILDCNRRLAIVVRMRGDEVHTAEIYDPTGAMLAHTLIDIDRERLQFVDPSGHLIATAEAPAINSSLTRASLAAAADPARAYVLPYEIHFEAGGYTNASQLLTQEYRWAVAVAVQSRAAIFPPVAAAAAVGQHLSMPRWYLALHVLGAFVATGFVFAIFFAIYSCVYPAPSEPSGPPRGYFRKPAPVPAVQKFASFVERRQFPSAAKAAPPTPPTSYIMRD